MPRHHDMGGGAGGPIDPSEHILTPFERRVDALFVLLSDPARAVLTADELRRAIEDLAPSDYDALPYYEKWLRAMTAILVEKGVLTKAGLDERVASLTRDLA